MKKILSGCLMLLTCLILVNCTKEYNSPTIKIADLDDHLYYYARDTIKIDYTINGSGFDSICLYVNDTIYKTQIDPRYVFNFIPERTGQYQLKLIIFYNSNKNNESKTLSLQVYDLSNPDLRLVCTRIDGEKSFFVGEKLNIIVEPQWFWINLYEIKQVTLFLNNENLGTRYLQPYSYETSNIINSENIVKLELIDTANHIYNIEMPLIIPFNTPPTIDFGIRYQNNIISGYYYSTDPIIYSISGTDNVVTHYVDYYLDDKYLDTDSINKSNYAYRELNIGTLKPGKHTGYCIAFDDRGDSTISPLTDFVVYKAIDINDKIIDIERSNDKSRIYAASKTKLYLINPESEEISKTIDLPFHDVTTTDFVSKENRLYIGFSDGHLIHYDEVTGKFTTILNSEITSIGDIKVDADLHIALLISGEKVLILNLPTKGLTPAPITVYIGSKLIMDQVNKIAVTGGDPGTSRSSLFKIKYNSNSMTLIDQKEFSLFIDKLLLKPGSSAFTIKENSRTYCTAFRTFDYNNFIEKGLYSSFQPQSACYNTDGKMFFIGNDSDKYIKVYNTDNFSLLNSLYIPLTDYNDVEHCITNQDNSKLVLFTTNVFNNEVKIVFVRL